MTSPTSVPASPTAPSLVTISAKRRWRASLFGLALLATIVGGRAEAAPRDDFPPAMTPEQSLKAIHVPKGLKVELVAAEPLISSPVAIDFGPDGKLWVAEMYDYPYGVKGDYQPAGRVRLLESTHGDGKFDKSTVFLDHVHFPNGITVWKKGVLVCAAPDIIYAEDTDGDGKADIRKVVFTGFDSRNWQARMNSLSYGLDNWIHGANGLLGGTVHCPDKPGLEVKLGIRDFRMDPDRHLFELESGGGTQQGRTRDDWGNYFSNQNSELLLNTPLQDRYVSRNPFVAPPEPVVMVPKEDPDHLYPISRTLRRFNHPESANRVTSACSPVIYRDDLLGEEYRGNAFMCEPVHDLLTRRVLKPLGATFAGFRAPSELNSEFYASADNWSRPVDVKNGPDGALWVVDMYRMIIEHPKWITADRLARINPRAGDNMGRIYRIVPEDKPARPWPNLAKMSPTELVDALDSPGGWQRDLVQFMLVDRGDKSVIPALTKMASDNSRPETRLQALCTLDGLGGLTSSLLETALHDKHPGVRRNAVRLCEGLLKSAPELGPKIAELIGDEDPQVRLQVACTLGEWDDPQSGDAIGRFALANQQEPYLFAAAMSSITKGNLARVAAKVAHSSKGSTPPPELYRNLMTMATAYGNDAVVEEFIGSMSPSAQGAYSAADLSAVAALLDGLDRQHVGIGQFATRLSGRGPALLQQLQHVADAARTTSADEHAPLDSRLAAVQILGRGLTQHDSADVDALGELLSPQTPASLQEGIVAALGKLPQPQVANTLLGRWRGVSPALRSSILDVLLVRDEWTSALLDRIEKKEIRGGEVDVPRSQRLMALKNRALADRAKKILHSVDADRLAVIRKYQSALTLSADPKHGRERFEKTCTICHRLNSVGHSIGPDLVALTDKSPQALIVAILDPNRAVEQKYDVYSAVTTQGRQYTGILAAETGSSITLLQQEGKQTTLLRGELEMLASTGKSLMPEGLEKDVKPQDLADIMAYIGSTGPSRKVFPGNQPALVTAQPDGTLSLDASNCEIYGNTLVLEKRRDEPVLAEWHSPNDSAAWTVDIQKPGLYTVSVMYSCHNESAGNSFQFDSPDKRITSRVEGTGKNWTTFFPVEIGKVPLKAGKQRFALRAADPLKGTLAKVASVLLIPPQ
jgi:putative membrane-bound dehydrogenase-like protein